MLKKWIGLIMVFKKFNKVLLELSSLLRTDQTNNEKSETIKVCLAFIIFTAPDGPGNKSFIMHNSVHNFATYLERILWLPATEVMHKGALSELLHIQVTANMALKSQTRCK